MANKTFKLSIIFLFCAGFIVFWLDGSRVAANSGGPPTGRTGAPGEQTCATSECHSSFPLNSGPGTFSITAPGTYAPDQEITVTVTLNQVNRQLYGFQITALDSQGNRAGTLINNEPSRTFLTTSGSNGRQYISHLFNGTSPNGTNQNSWTVRWKAPAQSVGQVTFYAAGNAANGNGTNGGDYIYTKTATIQPGATLTQFASVSAASFALNGPLAANAIVAGFGTGLSQNTAAASTVPLPTQLDGTEVRVRDANGAERPAGLFFVSSGQVNYLIPAGTANGAATITLRRNGVDTAQGTATIESVAPGLFAANANGQGVAAAVILRVRGGQQTFEPVAQFNAQAGRFDPIPIDLGPDTDQVILLLFGTGFRGFSALGALSCTFGGTNVPILGAAAVSGLEGLDQVNVGPVPRSLIGRGNVDVVFRTDNKTANTVTLNIK
jgi:uncharacterized protein (TIGR03437 family)